MTEPTDICRLPLLAPEEMTAEQREVYDSVVNGRRKRLVGPLWTALHSPELARRWSSFGEYLRFGTSIPAHLSELAILVAARRWTSQVEWWVHAKIAIEAGLPGAVVEAIRDLTIPVFEDEASFEVYEFTRTLQETGRVSAADYSKVRDRFGDRGVVELVAVHGYYTMVAMTLNAHQMPVQEPYEPLPSTTGLIALPPGRQPAFGLS